VDHVLQNTGQNLGYSLLELKPTGTMTITDNRAYPAQKVSITTMPLQYSYSCSVLNNANSCQSREVFEYGVDATVNPVDHVRHSYGWVRWTYYVNSTGGNPNLPAIWALTNTTTSDQLMPGQVNLNFQCF
jgi:hypothetical protein